jgi:hypothetical protein
MKVTYKQLAIAGVIVLILLIGSFVGGRYSSPSHEVSKSVLVVDTDEKKKETLHIVWDVKETTKVVHDVDTRKNVATSWKTTELPNGTKITETNTRDLTTVDDKTDSSSDLESHQEAVAAKTEEKHAHMEQSKTVEIDREKPQWSLSLQPGFDVAGALGHGAPISLLPLPVKHLMLGVAIDRRLFGPIFAGLWANSSGAGGVTIRAEF